MESNNKIYDNMGYDRNEVKKLFARIATLPIEAWCSNGSISSFVNLDSLRLSERTNDLATLTLSELVAWFVDGRLSLARESCEVALGYHTSDHNLYYFSDRSADTMRYMISGNNFNPRRNFSNYGQNAFLDVFVVAPTIFSMFELYTLFFEGKVRHNQNGIGSAYINYLSITDLCDTFLGEVFYKEVRCSLIHNHCLGRAALGDDPHHFYCGIIDGYPTFSLRLFYSHLKNDCNWLINGIYEDGYQARKAFIKLKSMY